MNRHALVVVVMMSLVALSGLAGCTSHAFAQKMPDGTIYVNGSSSFLFFSSSFIKRCTESGTTLTCEKLTVVDAGGDDASDDAKPRSRKKAKADDSKDDSDDDSGDKPKKKPKKSDDE